MLSSPFQHCSQAQGQTLDPIPSRAIFWIITLAVKGRTLIRSVANTLPTPAHRTPIHLWSGWMFPMPFKSKQFVREKSDLCWLFTDKFISLTSKMSSCFDWFKHPKWLKQAARMPRPSLHVFHSPSPPSSLFQRRVEAKNFIKEKRQRSENKRSDGKSCNYCDIVINCCYDE